MRDDTGAASEIVGSWADITHRKQVEQALGERMALMDDLPRSLRIGEAARARVVAAYSWSANLLPFASLIDRDPAGQALAS